MGYEYDIGLEQRFARQIKAVLGLQFIGQDPILDRQEATDFAIFAIRPFRVGARLRRYKYMLKYPDEFTIRWSRPSGVETEIHKIRRGAVDYIFYGFISEDENKILKWFIGDLKRFRESEPEPWRIFANNPPDSLLAVYRIDDMPPNFIVRRWVHKSLCDCHP